MALAGKQTSAAVLKCIILNAARRMKSCINACNLINNTASYRFNRGGKMVTPFDYAAVSMY